MGNFFRPANNNRKTRPQGINKFILIILALIIIALIQLAISRSREFAADNEGAKICEEPGALADALLKLNKVAVRNIFLQAEHNPATANLFIVDPLQATTIYNLFSTHPPIIERVKRLHAMQL